MRTSTLLEESAQLSRKEGMRSEQFFSRGEIHE